MEQELINKKNTESRNKVDFVNIILTILLVILILIELFFMRIRVPTESMANTIKPNDEFYIVKDFLVSNYKRGDIVVFKKDGASNFLVKRLIGLPGDKVTIVDGDVFVNDIKLNEDYLSTRDITYSGEFNVPKDSVLLLGDNRSNSNDARYWGDPYISLKNLKGKVIIQVKPIIRLIESYNYGE